MIENYYGHSQNHYGGDNCDDCDRYGGNSGGHVKVKAVMSMVGNGMLPTHKDDIEEKADN